LIITINIIHTESNVTMSGSEINKKIMEL